VQGFLYLVPLRPAAELDASNYVVSRFIYATRRNVPDHMVRGGVVYRILTDHLGSPRLVVNTETGEVAQRIDYDEFGDVIRDSNPGFQPFGFAGGLWDRDTRLVRFGARDYDPETGRWTAPDPRRFRGGDTNLYVYAHNSPQEYTDPTGEASAKGAATATWEFFKGLGRALKELAKSAGKSIACIFGSEEYEEAVEEVIEPIVDAASGEAAGDETEQGGEEDDAAWARKLVGATVPIPGSAGDVVERALDPQEGLKMMSGVRACEQGGPVHAGAQEQWRQIRRQIDHGDK